jgi:pimeloyl-CoA synthetase
MQTMVDYLKSRGVRVVNMSWADTSMTDYELPLEKNSIGKDAEEHKRMTQ